MKTIVNKEKDEVLIKLRSNWRKREEFLDICPICGLGNVNGRYVHMHCISRDFKYDGDLVGVLFRYVDEWIAKHRYSNKRLTHIPIPGVWIRKFRGEE